MLELKHISKKYNSKQSGETLALDDINVKFSDTGLVFILGKSGSGKSTFLNVLGGLDTADQFSYIEKQKKNSKKIKKTTNEKDSLSDNLDKQTVPSEILINDKSSNEFSESDFDSYRNTYIGFVFQNFNILEEYNVYDNIKLAVQLQNKKISEKDIDEILEQVDLPDYGRRRPNELSGGQRQRVAIARALIKEPSVILADEPTGALDSETSIQILNILKSLAKEKLIIVVSHDKLLAKQYADRIIYLDSGKIVKDESKTKAYIEKEKHIEIIDEDTIRIPPGVDLSDNDVKKIKQLLKSKNKESFISVSDSTEFEEAFPKKVETYSKGQKISKFLNTNESKLIDKHETKREMISSKFPLNDAIHMAFTNFKSKRFRLVLTIFLSIIALCIFGVASIMSGYDKETSYAKTFYEGNAYVMNILNQEKISDNGNSSDYLSVSHTSKTLKKLDDIIIDSYAYIYPVDTFESEVFDSNKVVVSDTEIFDNSSHPVFKPSRFDSILVNKNDMFKIAYGEKPIEDNECAISDMYAEYILKCGLRISLEDGSIVKLTVENFEQLLNKKIVVGSKKYILTGIFKTNYYIYKQQYNEFSEEERSPKNIKYKEFLEHYEFDKQFGFSSILVNDNFPEVYKNQLLHYEANLFMNVPNSDANEKASIVKDNQYNLAQGQVYLSALFYRNMAYGYNSTKTFEQLQSDFKFPVEYEFYTRISDNQLSKNKNYSKTYKVMGIYNDIETLGKPTIILNRHDFSDIVDETYMPSKIFMNSWMSGTDLEKEISTLHDNGFEVDARNLDSIKRVGDLMTEFVGIFYISAGILAVFVMLLMYSFIAGSIQNKQKEIGILRAIGARSIDVMLIFIIESLLIGLIILLFTVPIVGFGSKFLNMYLLSLLPVQLVELNFAQIWQIIGLTLGIVVVSSFFPVYNISRKKPIDAINNK